MFSSKKKAKGGAAAVADVGKGPEKLDCVLKDLELMATLGTGTFGRVRLVKYAKAAAGETTMFALKILKKGEIIRLKQVDHILSEVALLWEIQHPFIVNLMANFQDSARLYMVLEFVPGGELFSHLRKEGRFVKDEAQMYCAEIVEAFDYLHQKKIVYRDLKPENLLICRDGHLKITDFGFAKKVEDRTWTLCGTPEYLAPEIIQSKGHGKSVDWWALGVLCFEMLAGYPPFYDENPFGIYQKILAGRIEFPRHFDSRPKDLIKRLLTADRTKRIGCLKNGAMDVKKSKWLKLLDFPGKVQLKKMEPKFLPQIGAEDDTTHFDPYADSVEEPPATSDEDNKLFVGFGLPLDQQQQPSAAP